MIREEMLVRMRAAADESRAFIDNRKRYCRTCGRVHPATFVFGGLLRGWHEVLR